ncbi:MAG TPA: VWA domain-containing protein [Terracidiphilus sp.]|jgi:VWFA-related protein
MSFRLYLLVLLACVFPSLAYTSSVAQKSPETESAPIARGATSDILEGLIQLDVSVTDPGGRLVVGLGAKDFIVLDNGQPEKILTFTAYQGAIKPDPPVSVTLVLDLLRLPPYLASFERQQVETFLRQNGGRLSQPITILELIDGGLWQVGSLSLDGNALSEAVAHDSLTLRMGGGEKLGTEANWSSGGIFAPHPGLYDAPPLASEKALGAIAAAERRKPGRKLLLWVGPGWGIGSGNDTDEDLVGKKNQSAFFDRIVWFSALLRLARVNLYSFSVGEGGLLAADAPVMPAGDLRTFQGVSSPQEINRFDMNRKVLAIESGGRVLPPANDLVSQINGCLQEQNAFYSLSFDPAPAAHADEYHGLKIEVRGGTLLARTVPGYYDEPYFSDVRDPAPQKVTVAELEGLLDHTQDGPEGDLAERLGPLHLTERVSAGKLTEWMERVHDKKAREALEAMANESAFLDPPAGAIVASPPPDAGERRQILAKAATYLSQTMPKLPDFFATRTAAEYSEIAGDIVGDTPLRITSLHAIARSHVTVVYRNGEEIEEKAARRGKKAQLITHGTFGPALHMVQAALSMESALTWSHWEKGANGPVAVFGYALPPSKPLFAVVGCCLPAGDGTGGFATFPRSHGEITIDPADGAILRMVMEADLSGFVPVRRSAVLVDYGPVEIGGRVYTVPLRSVSLVRERTVASVGEWNESFREWGPYATTLNVFEFAGYHKFRSDVRILTGFTPGTDGSGITSKTPPPR